MMDIMKPWLPMIAVCLAALPAFAEPSPADSAAAHLFATTCLKYPDNPARLRVLLDTHLAPAEEANAKFFLGLRGGKVWFSKQSEGNFAVLVLDDGRCLVDGDTATADGVMGALPGEAETAGYKISTIKDDPKGSFHGVAGHVRTYRLEALGHAYTAKVSGTTIPQALLHAELTLDPAP